MTVSINFLFSPISVVVPFHVLDLCFVRQFLCDNLIVNVLLFYTGSCRFAGSLLY